MATLPPSIGCKKRKMEEPSYPFLSSCQYNCIWCDKEKCNLEGRLYCDQCLEWNVGQCTHCMKHIPFNYFFQGREGLCVGCEVKRRLKDAKKENPDAIKKQKEEKVKKKGPSMNDLVKQLRTENLQLNRDIIDLSKENFQLKQEKIKYTETDLAAKQIENILDEAMKEVYDN